MIRLFPLSRTLGDHLTKRDARLARLTLDAVLALRPLDVDLFVRVAYTRDGGLGSVMSGIVLSKDSTPT